jgi:hypothetical protein
MNRLALVAVTAVLLSAGCTPKSGSLGPGPTGSPPGPSTSASPQPGPVSPEPSSAPSTGAPGSTKPTGTVTLSLWFTHGGKIAYTKRTRPATVSTSQLALTELAAGPTVLETSAGLATGFPAGTTFAIAGISDGVETVSFSPGFYAGGRDAARLRQAQVVYTLTQFATVSKVAFQSDGQPLAAPVGRADYADLLPAIVVTSPLIGQRAGSPVTVAGTANVYEATVSVRVLDSAGRQIAATFTTATCGSGCRGSYSVRVSYRVTRQQAGIVEVYQVSAADGSARDVVRIPVTLLP